MGLFCLRVEAKSVRCQKQLWLDAVSAWCWPSVDAQSPILLPGPSGAGNALAKIHGEPAPILCANGRIPRKESVRLKTTPAAVVCGKTRHQRVPDGLLFFVEFRSTLTLTSASDEQREKIRTKTASRNRCVLLRCVGGSFAADCRDESSRLEAPRRFEAGVKAYAISSPRMVPVAEANLSVSRPIRCNIETKRLGRG